MEKLNFEDLISESRLAAVLDLSKKTIKNRVAAGLLPLPVRLPGSSRNYFLRGELETWLAAHTEKRPAIGEDPRKGPKLKERLVAERRQRGH